MALVRRLLEQGCTGADASRETGVPVATVVRWGGGGTAAFGSGVTVADWRPPDAYSYAYLLGIYLGDGHITVRPAGACSLRVALDAAYPLIVRETAVAIQLTSDGRRACVYEGKASRATVVQCSWKRWLDVFPQHGSGPKHERPIVLDDWQRGIVEAHPEALLRGLIHSDGCRTVNRFTVTLPSGRVAEYAYPRYFFTNLSADIRRFFCEACERVGVRWTQSSFRNISVADRRSVAILDRLVGPKA